MLLLDGRHFAFRTIVGLFLLLQHVLVHLHEKIGERNLSVPCVVSENLVQFRAAENRNCQEKGLKTAKPWQPAALN
jgi:hypothetical protein